MRPNLSAIFEFSFSPINLFSHLTTPHILFLLTSSLAVFPTTLTVFSGSRLVAHP